MTTYRETNGMNHEEQGSSHPRNEDQASGCQAPGMSQGFDSELGLTVDKLSTALKLPANFIKSLGVSDKKPKGTNVVTIPYLDENREPVCIKQLESLNGSSHFVGEPRRTVPYGFWNIPAIKKEGKVVLVPNEKDCWVCWHSGIPVMGLPENGNGFDQCVDYLRGLKVFLWDDNLDRGLLSLINEHIPESQVMSVPEDVHSLWQAHAKGMDLIDLIRKAEEEASPASTVLTAWRESQVEELRKAAMPVLTAEDPLLVIEEAIRALGYGGDIKPALITYLAATSRVLGMRNGSMPVHLLLKGPPSAGKSYTLQTVLRLLPEEAHYQIDAGSPRVLIYDKADLRHRVVIFSEADSMPKGEDNPAASALRTLMQECRLNYKVTLTDPSTGHRGVIEVSKPGPSVVITTSTMGLGPQMDSRVFTVEVSDSSEQIQAALLTQARLELEGSVEPDPALIAFQSLLQVKAPWDAVVPFADKLSKRIGQLIHASRINRDFSRLLSLIKTVAIIKSQQPELDESQRVIASLDDYATVYALVNKVYETSVTKVSDKIRDVIAAVEKLKQMRTSPISQSEVARQLGVHRQVVNQPVRIALRQGWLVNAETRKGYPANLDLGEPLPESLGLPKPEELEAEEAEDACGQSINGSDTTSNDVSDAHDCQGLTSPQSGDLISPTVVKASPDGDSDSIRQVKAVKCADCLHFSDWNDVPECMRTKEPIRNPHKLNYCERSELRESNRKSHDGEALGF